MNRKHGHSLAEDILLIEKQVMNRRQALRILGLSGVALLANCGGGSIGSTSAATSANAASGSIATTGSIDSTAAATNTTSTTAVTTTSNESCVVSSTETNGPFPADGTNTSNGATSNVLALANAVRSDIRSSFLGTSTIAPGVRMDLTIRLVNVRHACAALSGHAIYLWHCDAQGRYSLYDLPTESYLRGIQVTDSNGKATFTTILPGAYSGRYPHIHFEVFSSLAAATTGRSSLLVSQFAIPATQAQAVYADTTVYGSSASRFQQTPLSSDNVFGDNTASQITQQTIALSGSPTTGYSGTVLIGINA